MKPENARSGLLAWLGLLVAALIIASYGPLLRETQSLFGPITVNGIRGGIAALLLIAGLLLMAKQVAAMRRLHLERRHWPAVMCLGVFAFMTGLLFTQAAGVKEMPLTMSLALLFGVSNLCALPISRLVMKEPLTPGKLVMAVLALSGLGLYLAYHSGSFVITGVLAAVGAGVCDVIANSLRKRLGGPAGPGPLATAIYQYAIAVPIAIVCVAGSGENPIHSEDVNILAALGALAVLCIVTAMLGYLLAFGFKTLGVALGTAAFSLQVVFMAAIGWAFYQEHMVFWQIIGLGLLTAAGWMSFVEERLGRRRSATAGTPELI